MPRPLLNRRGLAAPHLPGIPALRSGRLSPGGQPHCRLSTERKHPVSSCLRKAVLICFWRTRQKILPENGNLREWI